MRRSWSWAVAGGEMMGENHALAAKGVRAQRRCTWNLEPVTFDESTGRRGAAQVWQ